MANLRSEFTPRATAAILVLALIWGFTFLLISLAVEEMTPLWLVAVRTATGFIALAAIVSVRRPHLPRRKGLWLHLAFLALPANVLPWTMVAWAQQTIASGLTAVLYSLIPMMTLLISVAISLERFTATKLAGLLVAAVGAVMVAGYDFAEPGHAGATLTVLLACSFLAAGAVYAKRFVSPYIRPLPMAAAQIGVATAISLIVATVVDGWPAWGAMGATPIAAAVTLGVLGTGVAFVLYYLLIDEVGATNATLVTYLIPVIGLLAGWLILDETMTVPLVVGALLIVSGVWLAQRIADRSRPVVVEP